MPAAPGQRPSPPRVAPVAVAPPRTLLKVLLVSSDRALCQAVARELLPGYELLHVPHCSAAASRLHASPGISSLVLDLEVDDPRGVATLLATLVERDFPGPRLLLSRHLRPEHASQLSPSCLTHFALPSPWAPGSLKAALSSALGR